MPAATIVSSGGVPVTEVESGAPVLDIVASGGFAITLTANGAPFVLRGGSAPAEFTMTQLASSDRIYPRTTQSDGPDSKGTGAIPVAISVTSAGTIYARKRRVSDNAIIQTAWLVGDVSETGSQTFAVSGVSAGTDRFYLDLSGDGETWQSGTTPVFMGALFGFAGQSLVTAFTRSLYDDATIADSGLTINPSARLFITADGGTASTPSAWVQSSDAGTFDSAGAVEFANLMISQTGVAVGVIGKSQGNTKLGEWQPSTGYYPALLTTLAAAGNRVEGFCLGIGHNDARSNDTDYKVIVQQLGTFWAGIDAVLATGYRKVMFSIPNITNDAYQTTLARTSKLHIAFYEWAQANGAFYLSYSDLALQADGIHPLQTGNIRTAQHIYRGLRPAIGLSGDDRGPLVTGASKTGTAISLPVNLQSGATSLVSVGAPATRFRVNQRGASAALSLDGTTPITVGTNTITLTLASDPGAVPLEVWPVNVHPINDGGADMIYDNHTDGDGIALGRSLWVNPYAVDYRVAAPLTLTTPTYSSTKFGGGLSAGSAAAPFPALPHVGNGVTVECWYKHLITSATVRTIFAQINDFWLATNNGNLVLTNENITTNFTIGQTYHIAVVTTPGGKSTLVFVDGVLIATSGTAITLGSNTNPFTIRKFANGSFQMGTGGEVAQVAIFKGARYLDNFTPPSAAYAGNEYNLLHLWKLDGNGNDTAIIETTGSLI